MEEQEIKNFRDIVLTRTTSEPAGVITYLDYSTVQNPKKDEPASLGLKAFTKFVELETYQVASVVGREHMQDLQKIHGIDGIAMLSNAIRNEMDQTISKKILSVVYELGERSEIESRTKFQRWANKWFGYEPKAYLGVIDTSDFVRRLTTRLLLRSNQIAAKCRMGPANFILTGPQMGSMLMDSHLFQIQPTHTQSGYRTNTEPYYSGNLGGMEVYIDPYMKWADKRILLGRKTTDPSHPGVIYLKGDTIDATIVAEETLTPKVIQKHRAAILAYGSAEKSFYMMQIAEREHNLFTHIMDRIKNKIKQLKKAK